MYEELGTYATRLGACFPGIAAGAYVDPGVEPTKTQARSGWCTWQGCAHAYSCVDRPGDVLVTGAHAPQRCLCSRGEYQGVPQRACLLLYAFLPAANDLHLTYLPLRHNDNADHLFCCCCCARSSARS